MSIFSILRTLKLIFNFLLFVLLASSYSVNSGEGDISERGPSDELTYEDFKEMKARAEARDAAKAKEREKILEEIRVISELPPSSTGPVVIRIIGTAERSQSGVRYVGDCDGNNVEDDIEIMAFSAPWKVIETGGNGNGWKSNTSLPLTREFIFEKSSDIAQKILKLDYFKERKVETAKLITSDLEKVAEVANGNIPLYWVKESNKFKYGYVALFPVVELIGFPEDPEFTNFYYAAVSFTPVGLDNFDGWSKKEVIRLYNTMYTRKCLGDGFKKGFSFFNPKLFYD